jgi:sister-chromatid-cohesion protein PDS5
VIDQDEEKVKARLEYVISAIARTSAQGLSAFRKADEAEAHFVDTDKAKKDMNTFAAVNEQKLYRLYRHCVDIQTDLQTLIKSRVSS